MRKIDFIVVHYTATYPEKNPTVSEIDSWHRKAGSREFGYHWYIDRQAKLFEGRPEEQLGAHVRGHNHNTIGVCWAGGLDHQTGANKGVWNPTSAQEAQLLTTIRDIKTRYPNARVVGHKDLVATECPGMPRGGIEAWWNRNKDTTPKRNPSVKANSLIELFKRLFGAK